MSTELVFVSSPDCCRCGFVKSKLIEWCNKNGYKFKEMTYSDKLIDITSVPSALVGNDVILDYDGIIELITSKKRFY